MGARRLPARGRAAPRGLGPRPAGSLVAAPASTPGPRASALMPRARPRPAATATPPRGPPGASPTASRRCLCPRAGLLPRSRRSAPARAAAHLFPQRRRALGLHPESHTVCTRSGSGTRPPFPAQPLIRIPSCALRPKLPESVTGLRKRRCEERKDRDSFPPPASLCCSVSATGKEMGPGRGAERPPPAAPLLRPLLALPAWLAPGRSPVATRALL